MTDHQERTKLTQGDLNAIESRVLNEVKALGEAPTLENLKAEGYRERRWLNTVLDGITGLGRITTLLVAEIIQSAAVLLIATVFGILEYQRVLHGAIALGQQPEQAALIALAVVTANVVYPIYMLRDRRNQPTHILKHGTARGLIMSIWKKLWGRPTEEVVNWSHNSTLSSASRIIKFTTIALAVYDLVAPLVISILTGTASKPMLVLALELFIGFGLSLAGVLFLNSASHEIGVRILTDQPKRLSEILDEKHRDRDSKIDAIRTQVTADHMAGKIEDLRRQKESAEHPFLSSERPPITSHLNGSSNERGAKDHAQE